MSKSILLSPLCRPLALQQFSRRTFPAGSLYSRELTLRSPNPPLLHRRAGRQDDLRTSFSPYQKRISSTACAAGSAPGNPSIGDGGEKSSTPQEEPQGFLDKLKARLSAWKLNAAEVRAQVAKLGPAAILAYGLLDGVTYTTFFTIAFLGYEAKTGQNPAKNLKSLLGLVVVMWTGNNVTRPFRVAGAAAMAPFVDKFCQKVQKALNLPSLTLAFVLVISIFATLCFSIVGMLILSRFGR